MGEEAMRRETKSQDTGYMTWFLFSHKVMAAGSGSFGSARFGSGMPCTRRWCALCFAMVRLLYKG